MVLFLDLLLFLLAGASLVVGQFNCTQANTAFCATPVSGVTNDNIIFRCFYDTGSASPGNCNDDLADVPPVGLKYAYCWESSPTAGDAQCTFNCVAVTAANGTTFYPVGCNGTDSTTTTSTTALSSTGTPSSSSLSSFGPSPSQTGSATSSATSSAATSQSTSNAAMKLDGASVWRVLAMVGGFLVV
ncbi:hypothetical protein AYL99_05096 [Fonsecaea erecta]|uniref:Uncharacterized protein n=1 Tax=Fonsecaea erecta TaxID=1367422 RepID=A0A178ZJY0_9EURO|nr:hypothetical protein AYL99_05096 [Fonsecaea erecta]OAP60094.1 hypothetical protein AYL99_05096 [Fonsecaea erecta]